MRYMRISNDIELSMSTFEAVSPDAYGEAASMDEERAHGGRGVSYTEENELLDESNDMTIGFLIKDILPTVHPLSTTVEYKLQQLINKH